MIGFLGGNYGLVIFLLGANRPAGQQGSHVNKKYLLHRLQPFRITLQRYTIKTILPNRTTIKYPEYAVKKFLFPLAPLLGEELDLVVPCRAELADERFFQELIGKYVFFPSPRFGGFADVPTVEVDSGETGVMPDTHRVKVAGNRFAEVCPPLAAGFLDSAPANAGTVATGKNTLLSVDKGSDGIPFHIRIRYSLPVDCLLSLGRQVVPYGREYALQYLRFAFFQRGARISFHAAGSLAPGKVAKEITLNQVEANQRIAYLNHVRLTGNQIPACHFPRLLQPHDVQE
jgi:hypothetical protein